MRVDFGLAWVIKTDLPQMLDISVFIDYNVWIFNRKGTKRSILCEIRRVLDRFAEQDCSAQK